MIEQITTFLRELSTIQDNTLAFLKRKGELLGKADTKGLVAIADEEEIVMDRLQNVFEQRQQILEEAKDSGLPHENLESLAARIDKVHLGHSLEEQCRATIGKSKQLQHQSLSNWVLAQRTAIHLSQLMDIISTQGRPSPTYSNKQRRDKPCGAGGFVDLGG